jgi:DNA repair protein RadC
VTESTSDACVDVSEDGATHEYPTPPLRGVDGMVSENEMLPLELRAAAARLLGADATAVADGELLELALGAGVAASDLLRRWHGLYGLARAGVAALTDAGLSLRQAMQLKAMLALGQRLVYRPLNRGEPITSAAQVYHRLVGQLGNREQEEFHVLGLDAGNRLLTHVVVAVGSLNEVGVGLGDVFRTLIRDAASSAIVVHNHPSGDCQPSECDKSLTVKLAEAAELLEIAFLDHIILARGRYFSFAERSEGPFRGRRSST